MRRMMPKTARTTRKKGQPRRRVRPLWRQPSLVSIAVLAAAATSGGGSWWLWQTGWVQKLASITKESLVVRTAQAGFSVSEIFVEGRIETEKAALLASLQLDRGAPILSFDLKQARARVIALPWVRTAVIERQLPNVIHLKLEERRPLALWQNKGRFSLIDTRGHLIPLSDIGRFNNLVVVVGRDAPRNAAALLDTLAVAPELARKVKAAVWVGERRWDVQLENRIDVKLPEANAIAAWVQLAEMQDRHQLLDTEISVIDLRLPDRIIVRQAPGGEARSYRGGAKISIPGMKPGSQLSRPGIERNT